MNPAAAPLLLTTHDEKLEVLAETGIDYFAVLPFTPELASYSAEDFVELVLRRAVSDARAADRIRSRLRHTAAGNVDVLRTLGERDGFQVDVVDAGCHARRAFGVVDVHPASGGRRRPGAGVGWHWAASIR